MRECGDLCLATAERAIGYTFKNPGLLVKALTHASVTDARLDSNERLEFLGDSVLGLVASERIYTLFPNLLEGEMTKIKSTAVSRRTCAEIADALGLMDLLLLGKGMRAGTPLPRSLAAAALEAVVAAIYLDGGLDAARSFLTPHLDPCIQKAARLGHQENFKSVLQQYAQQHLGATPHYRVLDERGPDHAKNFKIAVEIDGRQYCPQWGQSKKRAEQLAALEALREIGLIERTKDGEIQLVEHAGVK
ncbi:MAG: ribonuclease 3 [Phycisphaerales bacterium]|nr:MAG: ribonuclease 3 [Phycisphaerales bacterium]